MLEIIIILAALIAALLPVKATITTRKETAHVTTTPRLHLDRLYRLCFSASHIQMGHHRLRPAGHPQIPPIGEGWGIIKYW